METSELIKKVRKVEIKTKGITKQMFSGNYHSAFKGRGIAFSEVREYNVGDDIRTIDWNVTARSNAPHIKIFEEERELTVILLIDISGSENFGTKDSTKRDLITEISAILSFSAIQNNDKIGVIFFSDKIEKFIPPKKGKSHTLRIIRELIELEPTSTKTDLAMALKYFKNVITKSSIVFLISDFVTDSDYQKEMSLVSKRHDAVGIKVFDIKEYTIPNIGIVYFRDPETGKTKLIDTSDKKTRQVYAEYQANLDARTNKILRSAKVDLIRLRTNESYVNPLINFFKSRDRKY